MTLSSAPTSPLAEKTPGPMGVDEAVAQAFRSAAHAFQVQAAGLFRGGRMVAFASPGGALTMEQVGPAVTTSADVASRGSITRFFSPADSEVDYVLYATPVQGDLALVALFSMETPLGSARRTGQAIAQAMMRAGLRTAAATPGPEPEPEPEPEPLPLPRDWVPEQPSPELAQTLLGDRPSQPPPAAVVLPRDWVPSEPANESRFPFLHPAPEPVATQQPPAAVPTPVAPEVVIVTSVPASGPPLVFSMVLLPRFPEHRLTGALVERLRRWIHRLCLAWDWAPTNVDIRPDRLALTLSIGADTAPAQALQQLRDGLAARILQSFPELGSDLPSGRFWATPYLLLAGAGPGEAALEAFVRDTRHSQGFLARA